MTDTYSNMYLFEESICGSLSNTISGAKECLQSQNAVILDIRIRRSLRSIGWKFSAYYQVQILLGSYKIRNRGA